jgi:GNAT superfamily N-acetyltransferase
MSDIVLLRLAKLSERETLEALQLRASLRNSGDREALLANPDAIDLPSEQIVNGYVFVVEANDCIAGFASLIPRNDGGAELDALFVEPNLWRKGFARALISHCTRIANERGYDAIHVIGNPHAQDFYTAVGFMQVGTTETRFGIGLLFSMQIKPTSRAA